MEQITFVNREQEFALIDAAISDWGTRSVICITADGGIGKTRLLQEVQHRYASDATKTRLLLANIVDFDERAFHFPLALRIKTAQVLDTKQSGSAFDTYLQSVHDVRKMQMAGISEARLAQEMKETDQTFVDTFNSIASQQRIVLFFDTTEMLEHTEEKWRSIFDIHFKTNNFVLLVAGRNAADIGRWIEQEYNPTVQFINLQPLESKASIAYLLEMQQLMHITLDPELNEKLLVLAEGRPILLALAVEWSARHIPLDWLKENSLETLTALSGKKKQKRKAEFEAQLVHHIAKLRTDMERLILMMARAYPLDASMIAKLLEIPETQAMELFEQAQSYFFVKNLPGGHISLHDEMRWMVNAYVWPEVDHDGGRRQRDSMLIAECLKDKAETLEQQTTASSESDIKEKVPPENAQVALDAFIKREAVERELWILREQQLEHTLFVDANAGIDLFLEIFDRATQSYRHTSKSIFLDRVIEHIDKASTKQKYEILIRRTQYLSDSGRYDEARQLLFDMLNELAEHPTQKVDVLIQRANVEIRLGKLLDGVESFKQAVKISEEHALRTWQARAETGLGWAYRLTHDRQAADEHYQIALDLAIDLDMKPLQALLYNNLGFVHIYRTEVQGYVDRAIWFCQRSLAISEELKDDVGQGRSYSTLGCVSLIAGYFEDALTYFEQALTILEPVNNIDLLSQIYSWRGSLYMRQGKLELAENDLKHALSFNIKKDLPMTYSRLGRVYLKKGELTSAEKCMNECYNLALEIPEVLYQLVALRFLSQIALTQKKYERLDDLRQKVDTFIKTFGVPHDSRSLGICYFHLGVMALSRANIDQTVHYFEQGFKQLAPRAGYANDTLQGQVERLEKEIVQHQPSPEYIREIGARLMTFWKTEGLNTIFSDIRIILRSWTQWTEGSK